MRYAAIRSFDVTNGYGNGVSLFVQGCHFHCNGCFNQETWDFGGGKEWTPEVEERFLNLVGRDYIHRVSFLGGEPLCDENVATVHNVIKKIRSLYPDKQIWVYSGYTFEELKSEAEKYAAFDDSVYSEYTFEGLEYDTERYAILDDIDVLVDGRFVYDKRDITLAFRGSTNQRIIDVKSTMEKEEIVLWEAES